MDNKLKDLMKETENEITKKSLGGYCACCPLRFTCDKSYKGGGLTICGMLRLAQEELNNNKMGDDIND